MKRVSAIGTRFEDEARAGGFGRIAGLDEVGRGALAGPVVAAAVILDPQAPLPEGLDDSKKLTPRQRERVAAELRERAVCLAYGLVGPEEIDRTNILIATRRAMLEALKQLQPCADFLLIDALQLRESPLPQRAIIGGDAVSASIAAASVLAKTYRDALMREYHEQFPDYGFARHVGYGTREHWAALQAHGCCPIHRKSFRGVVQQESHEGDEASPLSEASSLKGEASSPAVEASSPLSEVSSPAVEASSLTGEVSSLNGEASSLAGELTSLKGELTSPTGDEASLKGDL